MFQMGSVGVRFQKMCGRQLACMTDASQMPFRGFSEKAAESRWFANYRELHTVRLNRL